MEKEKYYEKLLNYGYKYNSDQCKTELEYLSEYIFDFITYDRSVSELFARKAIEVCIAITEKKTFDYIKDENNYKWYLLMCNMQFFSKNTEWGTSVRGAWWNTSAKTIHSCGLWDKHEQVCELDLDPGDIEIYIQAIINFASKIDLSDDLYIYGNKDNKKKV